MLLTTLLTYKVMIEQRKRTLPVAIAVAGSPALVDLSFVTAPLTKVAQADGRRWRRPPSGIC